MASTSVSILDLDRSIKPLLGELCWEADWGEFTSLSLKFGTPRIELLREPKSSTSRRKDVRRYAARRLVAVTGRWKVWIQAARWRVVRSGERLATASSSYRTKQMALRDLKGQRLIGIQVVPQTGATRFEFDLDTVLEVRRMNRRSKEELWLIYGRDGYVRFLRGDGRFGREKLDREGTTS